ncbi:MAG: hypothetical protein PHQ52_07540, partial [Candidatus Omnitrophica bacterium]|nr:hypothetical protein [Candidatus Omnitrophota bacterium]
MRSIVKDIYGKVIAWIIIIVFTSQQLGWASDIYAVDQVMERQDIEQVTSYSPDYIAQQYEVSKNNISVMQDIEDFNADLKTETTSTDENVEAELNLQGTKSGTVSSDSNMEPLYSAPEPDLDLPAQNQTVNTPQEDTSFSVITEQGDTVYYQNNMISRIEKVDGVVFEDIVISDAGDLTDAVITYPDGSIQILSNKKVISLEKPNGMKCFYNENEQISCISTPEGKEYIYTYITDDQNNVLEIQVQDEEKIVYYTPEEVIKKVSYTSGKEILYDSNGCVSHMTTETGTEYIYNTIETGSGYETKLFYIEKENTRYYFDNNVLSYIELYDGTILKDVEFDDGNNIVSAKI